ncbi:MAG: hypothetical protein JWN08_3269 [Frankiales bacterium]|nr:hypothetical protein [Frankiales bacterium]
MELTWTALAGAAVRDETELSALYAPPSEVVRRKAIDHVDALSREYLALCRFVVLSSTDADGRCDATPRGGPPGFVTVLSDRLLALPDAAGNRRLDTLRNVVQTGRLGLLAVLPGRGQTLRVNGRACVSTDPELLDRLRADGRPPRAALLLAVEEVFTHCPKAFTGSGLWDSTTWPDADRQPAPAAMLAAHAGGLTLAEAEAAMG